MANLAPAPRRPPAGSDQAARPRSTAPTTVTPASARAQFAALTLRHVRALLRMPAYLAISIVQAVVWLPLFGSLFSAVADVPGFGGTDYIDFLTPGVVVMSALFSAGWAGMTFITDIDRGVMDRMLASPARRWALVGSSLAYQAVLATAQTTIIVLLGWALGTRYETGVPGVLVLIVVAMVLSMAVAGLSNALALVVRKEELLIAATNFLVLPLTFLSTATMARNLMPDWIQTAAQFNPVDWAVTAAREAIATDPDWMIVGTRLGCLLALMLFAGWLATRAFRAYQHSL
jgi:ABC-2 type transport system permease protein